MRHEILFNNVSPNFMQKICESFLRISVMFIKSQKTTRVQVFFLFTITFIQFYGSFFVEDGFIEWNDNFLDRFVYNTANQFQVIPYIIKNKSTVFYYCFYTFCILFIHI